MKSEPEELKQSKNKKNQNYITRKSIYLEVI